MYYVRWLKFSRGESAVCIWVLNKGVLISQIRMGKSPLKYVLYQFLQGIRDEILHLLQSRYAEVSKGTEIIGFPSQWTYIYFDY